MRDGLQLSVSALVSRARPRSCRGLPVGRSRRSPAERAARHHRRSAVRHAASTVGPPAMPWLEARIADPDDHWVPFTNAFLNTPLCCPSRASILTGLTSRHTGVQTNGDGVRSR